VEKIGVTAITASADTTVLIIDSSAGGANPVSRLLVMSCA
jgi:hypothetical protein